MILLTKGQSSQPGSWIIDPFGSWTDRKKKNKKNRTVCFLEITMPWRLRFSLYSWAKRRHVFSSFITKQFSTRSLLFLFLYVCWSGFYRQLFDILIAKKNIWLEINFMRGGGGTTTKKNELEHRLLMMMEVEEFFFWLSASQLYYPLLLFYTQTRPAVIKRPNIVRAAAGISKKVWWSCGGISKRKLLDGLLFDNVPAATLY